MSDINVGQLAEAINDKMDRDANNIQSPRLPIFLVAKQDPTNNNNHTWYRKYSDGWVEQGGQFAQSGDNVGITLPIAMANSNYSVVSGTLDNASAQGWRYANRTTTGFTKNLVGSVQCGGSWVVTGYAAS